MTTTTAPESATTTGTPRALPPGTSRNGGRVGLVGLQIRTELRATARSPEFVIGVVGIPALLYAMIGLPNASQTLPGGTSVGAMLFVSWAGYGVVSLAIFAFGEQVAQERARGWIRTMRATPLPTAGALTGKLVLAVLCASLVVASTGTLAATAGGVSLPVDAWVRVAAVLVGGVVAFATLGFAIAYLVRPRAAVAIANLVFLPLSFLSGFFVPLRELPSLLQTTAQWLPTHHLGQLAWRQIAEDGDLELWLGMAPASATTNVLAVIGATVLFGLLAAWGARREAVTRRG